jgi:hypothetical protein
MFTLFETARICISIKPFNWCWFYRLREAGATGIQIGPLVIERWDEVEIKPPMEVAPPQVERPLELFLSKGQLRPLN